MMESPPWLDEKLLSAALDGATIDSIETKPAVSSGENYLSTIVRVFVKYKTDKTSKEISFIIKSYPVGFLEEYIKFTGMLEKEVVMYSEVLPLMSEILGKYITPKSVNSSRSDVLILEDLTSDGFQMKNRVERLDLEHSISAVNTLAEFHAASVLVNELQPDVMDKVKREVQFGINNKFQKSFYTNGFKLLGDRLKSWSGLEQYSSRLHGASDRIWNEVIHQVDPLNCDFLVLNHGDFWTNNIMFRYEDEEIKATKLLDLQFCRWTTPAIDLHLFFTTSLKDRKCVTSLVDTYLNRLNSLIYPRQLSLDQLQRDLSRTECYGLMVAVSLLPLCLLDPKNAINFDDTTELEFGNTESPASAAYKDTNFSNIFPELLHHYVDVGLL